ncbi:PBP1A family penicillin-binding protein [Alkalicoccus urumqiensis]|nr:PBP1A family penicillin-binding protein [Alkalicoccus urumqiensis]
MSDLSRQDRRKKPEKPKKKKRGIIKKTGFVLLVLLLIGTIAGGIAAAAIISDAPELDREQLTLSQNPIIYDKDGEELPALETGMNRQSVTMDEIPPVMVDAVIAIEDTRFYDHFGVDIRRLGGAVIANFRSGFGSEGASTITQQVVKNLFLDFDKTITRKLQEQYLAVQLEQQFTKDQILEMYMNAIYFSDGQYGISAAAEYYFNKELSELTIEDAALLAGIPQRPNAHNPFNNPEDAEDRRNTVINRMEATGKISAENAESARSVSVSDQLEPTDREENQYQSYIDQVLSEVEEIEGIESSDIYTGGLKIYTNLDQDMQTRIEEIMQTDEYIQFPDEQMQAGVTLMETDTGKVRAIGGMREPAEGVRSWNWATNPQRQAGSAAKPIFAYGPVIDELQWSTAHQIEDEPLDYSNSDQPVRNFSRDYRGDVSMREALKDSLNVPAVRAIMEAGTDNAQQFASQVGIQTDEVYESSALGTNPVSSYEMAGAYASFGNGGTYNEPHTVERVEFPDGQEISMAPEPTQAMNDYTAYMVTDMLRDVIDDGTARRMSLNGFDAAGKTGSTNFTDEDREGFGIPEGADAIPDAWFVGYSPHLTASVWTGYDSGNAGYIDRGNNEHHISQDIFQHIMNYAHENLEDRSFEQPDSVVEIAVEEATGLLPSDYTPDDEIVEELFVRGTEPGTVSDEFELEEASDVSGLSASYDEGTDTLSVSWGFPEEELEFFNFRIETAAGGADFTTVDTIGERSYSFTGPTKGETYRIRVTPVDDTGSGAGGSAETSITIPEEEEPEEEIEENEENEENQENEENEETEENMLEENETENNENTEPVENEENNAPEENNVENNNGSNEPAEETPAENDAPDEETGGNAPAENNGGNGNTETQNNNSNQNEAPETNNADGNTETQESNTNSGNNGNENVSTQENAETNTPETNNNSNSNSQEENNS